MSFQLPEITYSYDALEPHIDAKTMEIHYSKHHNTYVANLNNALQGSSYSDWSICKLVKNLGDLPAELQNAVRNNGGGHINHSLFWEIIKPGGPNTQPAPILEAINKSFGSLDAFKEQFAKAALTRFGSGWAWLVIDGEKQLKVVSTANQDNPLMGDFIGACGCKPLLGLDVWEHAYYLNYQNRRPDYITAFWNIVNWDVVCERYCQAVGNTNCCEA